jgi:hypothetical protein
VNPTDGKVVLETKFRKIENFAVFRETQVCVCVCERERERKMSEKSSKKRKRRRYHGSKVGICVCVCVFVCRGYFIKLPRIRSERKTSRRVRILER